MKKFDSKLLEATQQQKLRWRVSKRIELDTGIIKMRLNQNKHFTRYTKEYAEQLLELLINFGYELENLEECDYSKEFKEYIELNKPIDYSKWNRTDYKNYTPNASVVFLESLIVETKEELTEESFLKIKDPIQESLF